MCKYVIMEVLSDYRVSVESYVFLIFHYLKAVGTWDITIQIFEAWNLRQDNVCDAHSRFPDLKVGLPDVITDFESYNEEDSDVDER